MSRIDDAFAKKKLFIGYLTAGDGNSKEHFLDLLVGGVDLLEIGIPFSDPIADGSTIQRAMEQSLRSGTTLEKVLDLVSELRKESETPIVLFTYLNPIQRDLKGFLTKAKKAGADGILIVDLPLEEANEYRGLCEQAGLDPIFVIAPSTPKERMVQISQAGRGFLYYACRKGTTGTRNGLPEDISEKISQIRAVSQLPIAVGFGISNRSTAEAVLKDADGFVVGSAFIDGIEKGLNIKQLAKEIKP